MCKCAKHVDKPSLQLFLTQLFPACGVGRALGFPTEYFTVLFAIPRMAGYLAHWRESLDDPDTKIMRPQQVRYPMLERNRRFPFG
jgi:citrate synthase